MVNDNEDEIIGGPTLLPMYGLCKAIRDMNIAVSNDVKLSDDFQKGYSTATTHIMRWIMDYSNSWTK